MYNRLMQSIVHSTIWTEDSDTRVVWVSLLALMDRDGFVYASIPGLAQANNLPIEVVSAAIGKFLSPDPHSSDIKRNPENEGRKLRETETGWQVINAPYYRSLHDADERRYSDRERKRRSRSVTDGHKKSAPPSASASASGNTEKKRDTPSTRVIPLPENAKEVYDHFEAKGWPEPEAEKFYTFYASKGWMVGKNPMKNWKMAATGWMVRKQEGR